MNKPPRPPKQAEDFAKRAYSMDEAARLYGPSRSSLYAMLRKGQLRSVKISGRRLIPRDALEALLNDVGDE